MRLFVFFHLERHKGVKSALDPFSICLLSVILEQQK